MHWEFNLRSTSLQMKQDVQTKTNALPLIDNRRSSANQVIQRVGDPPASLPIIARFNVYSYLGIQELLNLRLVSKENKERVDEYLTRLNFPNNSFNNFIKALGMLVFEGKGEMKMRDAKEELYSRNLEREESLSNSDGDSEFSSEELSSSEYVEDYRKSKNTKKSQGKRKKSSSSKSSKSSALIEKLNKKQGSKSKFKWFKHGGGQSEKVVKVQQKGMPKRSKTKIQGFHLGSESARAPRSYADERIAQAMRWVSTVLFNALLHRGCQPEEIQVAYFENKIYVAGNTKASIKVLKNVLGIKPGSTLPLGKSLLTLADDPLNENWAKKSKSGKPHLANRLIRHRAKLKNRILKGSVHEKYEELKPLLHSEPQVAMDENEKSSLHAERRIRKELGDEKFQKAITRGVKRPCAICFLEAYHDLPKDAFHLFPRRAGPLWMSPAATSGVDIHSHSYQEKLADHLPAASATIPKGEEDKKYPKLTYDMDTESNTSEDDSSVVPMDIEKPKARLRVKKKKSVKKRLRKKPRKKRGDYQQLEEDHSDFL